MEEEQASLGSIIIKYLLAFLMIIIILISVLGNLLVCLAICVERRLRNSGVGNWFLISLACADLLVGLLVMSLSLVYSLLDKWVFGEFLCRVWISMDVCCCTSSILNLCAICIDRYLHIKDPYNYDTYMNRKVVLLSILLIWSVSATISFVPLNLGWHKLDIFQFVQPHEANSPSVSLSGKQTISTINGSGDQMAEANKLVAPTAGGLTAGEPPDEQLKCDLGFSPLYAVVSSSISFYLPCIIMVALYTRLYLVARKHVRDIRKICKPQLVTRRDENLAAAAQQKLAQQADSPLKNNQNLLTCVPNTGSNRSNRSSRSASALPVGTGVQQSQRSTTINQHVADHKAAITIGIILFSFLFCWIPFFFMNIYLSFCANDDCVPSSVFQFLTWLGWCNSMLNPIIYSVFNREFRSAFYRLLTTWPIGHCSLLKWKHRFSSANAPAPASNAQQQLELKCSRATGSSECSVVAAQAAQAESKTPSKTASKTTSSKAAGEQTNGGRRASGEVANHRTAANRNTSTLTEVIQQPSNLGSAVVDGEPERPDHQADQADQADQEQRKDRERRTGQAHRTGQEQTDQHRTDEHRTDQPPMNSVASENGLPKSVQRQTSKESTRESGRSRVVSGEQKMMMVSLNNNNSKDAVIV